MMSAIIMSLLLTAHLSAGLRTTSNGASEANEESLGSGSLRLKTRGGDHKKLSSELELERYHREDKEASGKRSQAGDPGAVQLGFPADCLSYTHRYAKYTRALHSSGAANGLHPHSRYVVVMKLHQSRKQSMPQDEVLNVRALAAEVTQAGYHFYILFQAPTRDFYTIGEVEDTVLTREEMLQFLPLDLRPFVIVHDFETDFAAYPELGKHDGDTHPTLLWGPGPRAAYVAVSQFMQRYKAYHYAWVVEYDVRWTGSSWGEMLNSALSLGRQGLEAAGEEQLRQGRWMVPLERPASTQLPKSLDGLPDLLTFEGVYETDKWRNFLHNMANATDLWETLVTVYAGSRRFWEAVHDYSLRGIGSHVEICLPTIALQRGLKIVSLPLPTPKDSLVFTCCGRDAQLLYARWFNDSQACSDSWLVHPVKPHEAFWPTATLAAED